MYGKLKSDFRDHLKNSEVIVRNLSGDEATCYFPSRNKIEENVPLSALIIL